jgi:hypothetical protein
MISGKGTWRVSGNSVRQVGVEAGGDGVVAHVGLHALGAFTDRLSLGDGLSARIPPAGGTDIHRDAGSDPKRVSEQRRIRW